MKMKKKVNRIQYKTDNTIQSAIWMGTDVG